ncbi:M60 family peptidase N-terminal accessory domain-containing protein [uncultured Aquimarina sp.]|uniref:M60 family peptidase N-terminal accessory domain-containing protein n=1 Tax=uncultured Aquimarina sp. TaxID=575652 RepID=UPI00262328CE|nr:M60 family peptidase N-terminal accessory domain-containing protein [uncultured Aquimarina sp.]
MIKKYVNNVFKKVITITVLSFTLGINAQVANYSFEGNLDDPITGTTGIFGDADTPSELPTYVVTPSGGQGLQINFNEAFVFNENLKTLFTSDASFEIEVDFRYTYNGPNAGNKPLFHMKQGSTEASHGFMIAVRKSATPGKFDVWLNYSDGNWEAARSQYISTGELNINEEIKLAFKMNYDLETWNVRFNDIYNSGVFPDNFDVEGLKTGIETSAQSFGWSWNHSATGNDDSFIIDNFQAHVPARLGNVSVLQTALQQLTDHILGNTVLTQVQIDGYTQDVLFNHIQSYAIAKTDIDAYLLAFENNNPPLFNDRTITYDLNMLDNFERVTYYLQQDIFNSSFVSGNMANVAGVSFEAHEAFPGPVSASAPRISNGQVAINASYILDPGIFLIDQEDGVIRPTGYYAAPGELVTITVPPSMVGQNIEVISGSHQDEVLVSSLQRFKNIVKRLEITSTTTEIANPFGGTLYFRIPANVDLGWSTVTIDGAVKAPYFRMVSGQPQNVSEWVTDLNNNYVPWVDIETDKWMFTIPTSVVGQTDITDIMKKWDEMQDLASVVAGRPMARPRAEYIHTDCSSGNGSYGYPKPIHVNGYNTDSPTAQWSPLLIFDQNYIESHFRFIFHEMGHTLWLPTPAAYREAFTQLTSFAYLYTIDEDFDRAMINNEYGGKFDRDLAAMHWMITNEFRTNVPMLKTQYDYQRRGAGYWYDMFALYGFESVGNIHKEFYNLWASGADTDYFRYKSIDEYIGAAAAGNNKNLTPLFHFWGMQASASQVTNLASYPEGCEIYNRLMYYRSQIPQTQAEFASWRTAFEAATGGSNAEVNTAFANWDSQNYYAQIVAQIDNVINTYYPSGSNCANFTTTWTVAADDTTITIPTETGAYSYNYEVNWNGDGDFLDANETTPFTGNATHDFGAAGTYTINIRGTFPAIYFNNSGDKDKITSVDRWGSTQWEGMDFAFYGCTNLSISENAGIPDLSFVSDLSSMFRSSGINTKGNLDDWDVSSIEFFDAMFMDAVNFDQSLGNWDIGNVGSMSQMLQGVTISTTNYDDTLTGWATLSEGETDIPIAIDFHGGNSGFCLSDALRTQLITSEGSGGYGWTITDSNVLDCEVEISPVVYLQGAALNPNTGEEGLMRDDLRVAGLIPITSPYADALTCDSNVFNVTGNNAIADWVWIELRDATNTTTIIGSRSALLKRDGKIVDVDGVSTVKVKTNVVGDYYVVVRHRNHLGIRAQNPKSFTSTPVIVDLSIDASKVVGGANALQLMPNGKYAVIVGDYDENGQVQNADVNAVIQLLGGSGYNKSDMDMNGQIQNTDVNTLMNPNLGKGEQF